MAKGISLHIGVNYLDKSVYGSCGALASPENSARALAGVAVSEGYASTDLLLTEGATKNNVCKKINDIAKQLVMGDIFFLSYSGHGGQLNADDDFEEDDGKNECWCLHDGFLIDDVLGSMWAAFDEGVKIVVVTDCCHSRTSMRDWWAHATHQPLFVEGSPRFVAQYPDEVFRYKTIGIPDVKAGLIHISACGDEQEAYDGDTFSRFISILLSLWNYGQFEGSYVDLVSAIKRQSGYSQEPALGLLGNVHDLFINDKPFKI